MSCRAPPLFGSTSRLGLQFVVLVSAFVMVTTVWSVSCLLYFYSWCPRVQPFVKLGHVPPTTHGVGTTVPPFVFNYKVDTPSEGGMLGRPRHYSTTSVQPMPKAAYRSNFRENHCRVRVVICIKFWLVNGSIRELLHQTDLASFTLNCDHVSISNKTV